MHCATFGEMRAGGVRGLLTYCSDYKCSHWTAISGDRWPDGVRLSDIEQQFVCRGYELPLGGRNPARYSRCRRSRCPEPMKFVEPSQFADPDAAAPSWWRSHAMKTVWIYVRKSATSITFKGLREVRHQNLSTEITLEQVSNLFWQDGDHIAQSLTAGLTSSGSACLYRLKTFTVRSCWRSTANSLSSYKLPLAWLMAQMIASGCACRKSDSHIQMMKSAEKWRRHNATNGMYCSRRRRVLVD